MRVCCSQYLARSKVYYDFSVFLNLSSFTLITSCFRERGKSTFDWVTSLGCNLMIVESISHTILVVLIGIFGRDLGSW